MNSSTTVAFVVQYWPDGNGGKHVQIVCVDTALTVALPTSHILIRFTRNVENQIERCYLRHIASGREVYLQAGPGLRQFVETLFLEPISNEI